MANKFVNGFIQAKWWAKLLLAVVFLVLFLLIINFALKFGTNHGQSLPVPKIKGLVFKEAIQILDDNNLRYIVFDSVYVPKAKKGEIIDQNPAAGSKVKKNRIIYLTINARPVPIVKVPQIIDIGLREAISKLKAVGLEAGEITTKPDITENRVMSISFDGNKIEAGDAIEKGSKIDLVVSRGETSGDNDITMPNLEGLTLDEATIELSLYGLNAGTITYDNSVTDKATAKIYRQAPDAGKGVYLGKEIDLFLKQAD